MELSGFHQPSEWDNRVLNRDAQAAVSFQRLKRLHSGSEVLSADPIAEDARSCHREDKTLITKIAKAIDSSLVDSTPGSVNVLTGKGIAFVTLCSTLGFHALRLILRDSIFSSGLPLVPRNVILKRKIAEIYVLSAIHTFGCAAFSLRKILSGNWDSPRGAEAMLCFSLGYTTYSLLVLRSQLVSDPLFACNEIANFVKLCSCLKSRGVKWIVPLLMSGEIPSACLHVLRFMAEMGTPARSLSWRFVLGAFSASFIVIKGLTIPLTVSHFIMRRAKQWPELHQPDFLPAKLALVARLLLSYGWLGIVAKQWLPSRLQRHPEASYMLSSSEQLPLLRDLTTDLRASWKALGASLNPISLLYFLVLQSCYFLGPAALPGILYTLARKPGYRIAAGSSLLGLLALTFWPIRTDRPFRTQPLKPGERSWLGKSLRWYFSFKSVYEEPLQKDRRYLLAVLPHGMMPYASTCLLSQLNEEGFIPATVGADVLFQIPLLRQLCRWSGVLPATKKSMMRSLSWNYPNNITILVPGGIAEIFLMRKDVEQVFIKSRKGFIRLALQAGVDIVPVYGLGHTQLFTMFDSSSGLGRLLMQLSRRLQISLPLGYGRFGMPLVPYSKPLAALVGKPIRVDAPNPNPSNEEIDKVHSEFLAELTRVYEKHKHLVPGFENKKLYFEDEKVPELPRDIVVTDNLFPSALPMSKL